MKQFFKCIILIYDEMHNVYIYLCINVFVVYRNKNTVQKLSDKQCLCVACVVEIGLFLDLLSFILWFESFEDYVQCSKQLFVCESSR